MARLCPVLGYRRFGDQPFRFLRPQTVAFGEIGVSLLERYVRLVRRQAIELGRLVELFSDAAHSPSARRDDPNGPEAMRNPCQAIPVRTKPSVPLGANLAPKT